MSFFLPDSEDESAEEAYPTTTGATETRKDNQPKIRSSLRRHRKYGTAGLMMLSNNPPTSADGMVKCVETGESLFVFGALISTTSTAGETAAQEE